MYQLAHSPPYKYFSTYSRILSWTEKNRFTEVPIEINGLLVDLHTYIEQCGNEA